MTQSKAITVTDISKTVHEWAPALKDFALVDFNQQRFFKSAILAIAESAQLMECMTTPSGRESLYNAMKRAFSTGLSLNPQEGKAAIIAYKGQASYQIMKEGAVEILMRTGDIKEIMVESVYENDDFKITKSNSGDVYEFSPARRDRGKIDGFFCCILDNENISHVKYMTHEECLEVRDNYSSMYKFKKESSPWFKSEIGMCKKTVIKSAIRDLRLSPSADAQIRAEDIGYDQKPDPIDITPPRTGSSANDVTSKLKAKSAPKEEPAQVETKQSDRF